MPYQTVPSETSIENQARASEDPSLDAKNGALSVTSVFVTFESFCFLEFLSFKKAPRCVKGEIKHANKGEQGREKGEKNVHHINALDLTGRVMISQQVIASHSPLTPEACTNMRGHDPTRLGGEQGLCCGAGVWCSLSLQ